MSLRVRSLLRRVSENESSSPYQARLQARVAGQRRVQTLEKEIASEVAYSLGRAGRLLRAALDTLSSIEAEHASCTDRERRQQLGREHADQRQEALRRLRYLQIQREALGFRRHDELQRLYPIPHPLTEP